MLQQRIVGPKRRKQFDVTMGPYHGAEVCELIGIFMLSLLSKHINKNHIMLYKDDGLAILKNTSGPAAEKLKKKFQKLFKEKDLDITVQCNLKNTNYLSITLNLNDGLYRSYRKPNEETKNLLSKRSKVISQCRHRNKFKLVNLMSRKTPNDAI